jgi:hypothetical protein
MAESAMAVSVEPDLGGNNGQGRRLAFRTIHENTSGGQKHQKTQNNNCVEKVKSNPLIVRFSTANEQLGAI